MIRGIRARAKTYPAVERTSAAIRQPSCIAVASLGMLFSAVAFPL
jgi:hypothetical protein